MEIQSLSTSLDKVSSPSPELVLLYLHYIGPLRSFAPIITAYLLPSQNMYRMTKPGDALAWASS